MELSFEYVAGLLDGEGAISIGGMNVKGNGKVRKIDHVTWNRRIFICNTYFPILQLLKKQFGGTIYKTGNDLKYDPELKWKQSWRWNLHGKASANFIKRIYPYLIIKKLQADIYLKFAETVREPGQHTLPDDILKLRQELYQELIKLNSKGRKLPKLGKIQLPRLKGH